MKPSPPNKPPPSAPESPTAGLVAITPAAGFVTVPASIIIGLGAGGICSFGVQLVKQRFGVDDALDVVGVHGIGGTWGALATGVVGLLVRHDVHHPQGGRCGHRHPSA